MTLLRLYLKETLNLSGLLFFCVVLLLGEFSKDILDTTLQTPLIWAALWLLCQTVYLEIWQSDKDSGRLDTYALSNKNFIGLIATRMLAVWLGQILPVILILPLVGNIFLTFTAAVASFGIFAIAALTSALNVGMRQNLPFASLLTLPLSLPVLLFGSGAVQIHTQGLSAQAPIGFLLALVIFFTLITPFLCAAILRAKLSD